MSTCVTKLKTAGMKAKEVMNAPFRMLCAALLSQPGLMVTKEHHNDRFIAVTEGICHGHHLLSGIMHACKVIVDDEVI